MDESKRTFSLGLAVAIFGLITSALLVAAEPRAEKSDWYNLKKLAPGQDIRIVLNDMNSYEAKFQSVTDDTVVVRLATGDQPFTRESVLRVSFKRASHRGRDALIGAGVGVAAGLAVAASDKDSTAGTWARDTVSSGLLGAGIGALVSKGAHWHDIYRAR